MKNLIFLIKYYDTKRSLSGYAYKLNCIRVLEDSYAMVTKQLGTVTWWDSI